MNMPIVRLRDVAKTFTVHQRGAFELTVLRNVNIDVFAGKL